MGVFLLYKLTTMKHLILALLLTGCMLTGLAQDKEPVRCEANNSHGERCHNKAIEGKKYCHYHDPATPRCGAKTAKGTPCKVIVHKVGEKCWRHKDTKD